MGSCLGVVAFVSGGAVAPHISTSVNLRGQRNSGVGSKTKAQTEMDIGRVIAKIKAHYHGLVAPKVHIIAESQEPGHGTTKFFKEQLQLHIHPWPSVEMHEYTVQRQFAQSR